jgi:hypothetical protein
MDEVVIAPLFENVGLTFYTHVGHRDDVQDPNDNVYVLIVS